MRVRAIHQMLAGFASGDAISNHALQIQRRLRAWGYESRLFAEHYDHRQTVCEDYRAYTGDPRDILILHYSIGAAVTGYVRTLPGRLVVYYHNITPAHFMRPYNARLADELERGRIELTELRAIPHVLAASDYNALELTQLGFAPATIVPYFIEFDQLGADIHSSAGQAVLDRFGNDDWINLLFVGRIAPHKRQDDLIRLFAYYQWWVRPRSRLLLIGSDVSSAVYRAKLEMMVEAWQLREVHLPGPALKDELAGYYRVADLFVSMSEHEGFCVPLIEAMALGMPVLAYAATAVPDTMGPAGVLARCKRFDVLGEIVEALVTDQDLRQRLIAQQHERVQAFAPQVVEAQLRQFIDRVVTD